MAVAMLQEVVAPSTTDCSWVEQTPELDDYQAGALRRILNLSARAPNDWSGMFGPDNFGEDFSALRFQLAYMAYALALAHLHRLPAAPGVFREPFDNLIQKILSPDCWIYWSHVSTADGPLNKHLGKLPQKWDPVAEDNIMYSAYVQSMALMYHYLFRDDKYAQPGALTFELKTKFWNEGGFKFPYDEKSLNELIYWQMAEMGFLGVACEPDCVFQICNQPNLIGFRMHDLVYGGDLAGEASQGYIKAWSEFGMIDEGGFFRAFVIKQPRLPITIEGASMNFWLMTLLHSWYPKIVEQQYPILKERYLLDGPQGSQWIMPPVRFGATIDDPRSAMDMSWAACCASEMGDTETLTNLLAYADRFMNPVWEDGAYFYKRRDENFDKDGYFIGMDPASGNAMFNYARLNVKDGLKKLFEGGWDKQHFDEPALLDVPGDVDVRRAFFDSQRNALAVTLGKPARKRAITLEVSLPNGRDLPAIFRDGEAVTESVERSDGGFTLKVPHGKRSTFVFQW